MVFHNYGYVYPFIQSACSIIHDIPLCSIISCCNGIADTIVSDSQEHVSAVVLSGSKVEVEGICGLCLNIHGYGHVFQAIQKSLSQFHIGSAASVQIQNIAVQFTVILISCFAVSNCIISVSGGVFYNTVCKSFFKVIACDRLFFFYFVAFLYRSSPFIHQSIILILGNWNNCAVFCSFLHNVGAVFHGFYTVWFIQIGGGKRNIASGLIQIFIHHDAPFIPVVELEHGRSFVAVLVAFQASGRAVVNSGKQRSSVCPGLIANLYFLCFISVSQQMICGLEDNE